MGVRTMGVGQGDKTVARDKRTGQRHSTGGADDSKPDVKERGGRTGPNEHARKNWPQRNWFKVQNCWNGTGLREVAPGRWMSRAKKEA
ncbi:hypothetical protein HK19_02565 [Acetobacter persici]|nr:hypothetical protein HK19_02565 [Acetobacter persici]